MEAHLLPLCQVEPLREYNDHFETTLTGESGVPPRAVSFALARVTCSPPDEDATIDLGKSVGFFRLIIDKDRAVLDLTAPVSGAQTYKFGASPPRARDRAVMKELTCPQIPHRANGWASSTATISRFVLCVRGPDPYFVRSRAPALFAQGLLTRDILRVTKGGIPLF